MTVDAVLGLLADGYSIERVLADHPALSESAVRACIEYSLQVLVNRRSAATPNAKATRVGIPRYYSCTRIAKIERLGKLVWTARSAGCSVGAWKRHSQRGQSMR